MNDVAPAFLCFLLLLWRTLPLRGTLLLWMTLQLRGTLHCGGLYRCGRTALPFTAEEDWTGCRSKRSRQTQTSLVQSIFSTFFPVVGPSADWDTPSPLSQHHPPPFFKCYFLIHKLILLMLGQCTNPGPSFSCPICHHQQIKSKYFYQY